MDSAVVSVLTLVLLLPSLVDARPSCERHQVQQTLGQAIVNLTDSSVIYLRPMKSFQEIQIKVNLVSKCLRENDARSPKILNKEKFKNDNWNKLLILFEDKEKKYFINVDGKNIGDGSYMHQTCSTFEGLSLVVIGGAELAQDCIPDTAMDTRAPPPPSAPTTQAPAAAMSLPLPSSQAASTTDSLTSTEFLRNLKEVLYVLTGVFACTLLALSGYMCVFQALKFVKQENYTVAQQNAMTVTTTPPAITLPGYVADGTSSSLCPPAIPQSVSPWGTPAATPVLPKRSPSSTVLVTKQAQHHSGSQAPSATSLLSDHIYEEVDYVSGASSLYTSDNCFGASHLTKYKNKNTYFSTIDASKASLTHHDSENSIYVPFSGETSCPISHPDSESSSTSSSLSDVASCHITLHDSDSSVYSPFSGETSCPFTHHNSAHTLYPSYRVHFTPSHYYSMNRLNTPAYNYPLASRAASSNLVMSKRNY